MAGYFVFEYVLMFALLGTYSLFFMYLCFGMRRGSTTWNPYQTAGPGGAMPAGCGLPTCTRDELFHPNAQPKMMAELSAVWKKAFVRKVYSILGVQLFVTTLVPTLMMVFGGADLMHWVRYGGGAAAYPLLMFSFFGTFIALMCCRQTYPTNMVLLAAFTLSEACLLGFMCTAYAAAGLGALVLEAFVITSIIFVGLTLYVHYSKRDFDFLGPAVCVGSIALLFFLIFAMFIPTSFSSQAPRPTPSAPRRARAPTRVSPCAQLIGFIGVVLFSLFIVYDTHVVMNRLSYDQYLIGVIELYLDFVNLFLCVLQVPTGGQRQ